MGFFDKLKKITSNLFGGFTEADEAFFEELEETLILADLGMDTSLEAVEKLRQRVRKEKLRGQEEVKAALRDVLVEMMDVGETTALNLESKPAVVLFIGVNGVGKTTSIGKLGNQLKNEGKRVLFCAADTFRAAAADQLQIWSERAGCELVRQKEGTDPGSVLFDALQAAKARNVDVVLCDTAGRLHNKANLMAELAKLSKIIDPAGVNLVYGGRQLGKSALLKKACRDTDKNQGSRAVYVDLKTARTVGEAALALSRALVMNRILPKGSETDNWDALAYALRTRLMVLEEGQEPIAYLLVLLDEADSFILDSARCDYQPIDLLKAIQQDLPGRFKFVLAGLHNVVRFKRRQALGSNSGIPHLPFLNVTPFDSDDALSLLIGPLGFLGFALENEALASEILATTNYFPGLIQLYGKKLVESIRDEDYADYSVGETPPYVITDDHLRHVLSDSDFVKELRSKLEMTLRLDEKDEGGGYYEAIALLIAGRDHADQAEGGYSAELLHEDGKNLLPRRMGELKAEQVATLLEELCDLNILRELGQGTYVFSSKRFRDLMGTADEIFERMEEMEGEG